MRSSLSRWSVGAVIGALLFGISGCKSGVSSPTDWFSSWGKRPSPTAFSSTAPRKPSASTLPNPRATTVGQTGLVDNSYPNNGVQGYPASPSSSSPNGYNTGPYGMASRSTPGSVQPSTSPYGLAGATGGSPYPANTNTPYAGPASPYSSPAPAQAGAYTGSDNAYRTADARSATTPSGYEPTANAHGGQPATYSPGQGSYAPPTTQNWGTQAAPGYPAVRATETTGLNSSAGPYQPGSTNSSGALPTNAGSTNLQGGASTNYPGSGAPTGYPSGAGSESGGGYPVAPAGQPATPASSYPTTGPSTYPATGGTGQGYSSPYPNSGY
ncbi:MAG: hypothetical protein QGG09_03460 [Pirellulaceae bacterium]|nr:hypothetical protein [Pirellulaceae bacterium]HJN08642.1 hypothetical protein [Pirellulaceae bacterium]